MSLSDLMSITRGDFWQSAASDPRSSRTASPDGGHTVAFGTALATLDAAHEHYAQIAARTLRGATVGTAAIDATVVKPDYRSVCREHTLSTSLEAGACRGRGGVLWVTGMAASWTGRSRVRIQTPELYSCANPPRADTLVGPSSPLLG